ncbi:hypothetical protein [Silicimonas sp. MF1-12-2]|uniref:hypothetical protein n=1 Tax=Silicimonas sp. MF1-12-2 TaxID=3384793 RepID=UPI0039B4BDE6
MPAAVAAPSSHRHWSATYDGAAGYWDGHALHDRAPWGASYIDLSYLLPAERSALFDSLLHPDIVVTGTMDR